MLQTSTNQPTLSLPNQTQKRLPGGTMNSQHDQNKNGSNGGNKVVNRRGTKNRQQHGTSLNTIKKGSSNQNKAKSNLSRFDHQDKVSHRKNQSVDNLLNFHYMPLRSQHGGTTPSYNNGARRKRTTTFNKEAFLQANCQFVVKYNIEKYQIHSADPDVLVEWDSIQLVYFPTHEQPSCPICLYPPTAAKMTKCGHVYCWSCILHYLSLSDKSWNKCPICHEAIRDKDLKSVIPVVQNKFARNGTIKMKLMKRSKNSLTAHSYNNTSGRDTDDAFSLWNGEAPNTTSKLMLATPDMVVENLLKREQLELKAQRSEALQEKSGEIAFIEMALKKIEETMQSCVSNKTIPLQREEGSKSEIYCADRKLAQVLSLEDIHELKQQAFSDEEDEKNNIASSHPVDNCNKLLNEQNTNEMTEISTIESENISKTETENISHYETVEHLNNENGSVSPKLMERKAHNSESSSTDNSLEDSPKIAPSDSYYFYQAEDGQNIFVNTLNARCLIEEYGSLENAPKTIIGQILDFESFTMTKELRKRYRYLCHLPVSCEFVICELMLRPPILSKHTIHNFMGEFKKRKASRLKKSEEQRRHDVRANAELSREAGFRVYRTEEDDDVQIDLTDMEAFPSNLSPDDPATPNGTPSSDVSTDKNTTGSFSQMLKAQNTASSSGWPPNNNSVCNASWGRPSFSAPKSVYTRSFNTITSSSTTARTVGEDEDGPNIVAPSLKEMFTAAMVMQSSCEGEPAKASAKKTASKKGKKGNNKGKLLFATGAQRKY